MVGGGSPNLWWKTIKHSRKMCLFLFGFLSVLVLSACGNVTYQERAFPDVGSEEEPHVLIEGVGDCVGVENGYTYGFDLLSSLMVNEKNREMLSLEKYSKDYVGNLIDVLDAYGEENYGQNFTAVSACNLDNGMDLTIGYFGKISCKESAKGCDSNMAMSNMSLFLIDHGDVTEMPEDLRLFNNTATGAGVMPCSGEFVDGNIQWGCFMGLATNENGAYGDHMKYWLVDPINSEILEVREDIEAGVY